MARPVPVSIPVKTKPAQAHPAAVVKESDCSSGKFGYAPGLMPDYVYDPENPNTTVMLPNAEWYMVPFEYIAPVAFWGAEQVGPDWQCGMELESYIDPNPDYTWCAVRIDDPGDYIIMAGARFTPENQALYAGDPPSVEPVGYRGLYVHRYAGGTWGESLVQDLRPVVTATFDDGVNPMHYLETELNVTVFQHLNEGEYIGMFVYQNSGAAMHMPGGGYGDECWMGLAKVCNCGTAMWQAQTS